MQIALKDLRVSKENPRKTPADAAAHAALVASIKAHGLIQPLVVRPQADNDNKYDVIEGGRRMAALSEIGVAEVDCVVNESAVSIGELGTVANMMREAMHPLDECTVISRLFADGETAEAIGVRFGQTARWVEQRAKLAGLSPAVQKLYRAGEIDGEAAKAFTLGTKQQQEAYVKSVKVDWQLEAETIENAFTDKAVNAAHAIFDLAQYPEKSILRDLFGDDVYFTDREKFTELQTIAINTLVENLKAEGWSDVLVFMGGRDYAIENKYVAVEGRIKKEDRSKYVSMVVFDPRSGAVSSNRGFVLRKNANKVKVGETPADDVVADEDVKPQTAYDLNKSQLELVGAFLTRGIERAIAGGDTYLALKMLIGNLLSQKGKRNGLQWSGVMPVSPNYIPANVMLADKIENEDIDAGQFPERAAFEKMLWDDVEKLIQAAALNAMQVRNGRDKEMEKELEALKVLWFRWDEGFLKRYRLDALQNLAKRLKIAFDGKKKKDLVADVLAVNDQTFIPLK